MAWGGPHVRSILRLPMLIILKFEGGDSGTGGGGEDRERHCIGNMGLGQTQGHQILYSVCRVHSSHTVCVLILLTALIKIVPRQQRY